MQMRLRAGLAGIGMLMATGALAGNVLFTPLTKDGDNAELHTGLWWAPDLGRGADVFPLKSRIWATKESVTDGVALKCVFEPGSKSLVVMEQGAYPEGAAGLTFYAKASAPLKLKVVNATADVSTAWSKIDLPLAALGAMSWRGVTIGVAEPVETRTWLILDRIGYEGPTFDPRPAIRTQAGPDAVLSSRDMLYGAQHLAKVRARLKAGEALNIVAIGDAVTSGLQARRNSPGLQEADAQPYLYYAHLAQLLRVAYQNPNVTATGHGLGSTVTRDAVKEADALLASIAPDDLVILQFGAHDIGYRGGGTEPWEDGIHQWVEKLRASGKGAQILVLSPPVGGGLPGQAPAITKALQKMVEKEDVAAADVTRLCMYRGEPYAWALLANHYHPSLMGHMIMAEMIAPILTDKPRNYPE